MLLRESSYRPVEGGCEVAASPDTPGRETWTWQVRLLGAEGPVGEAALALPAARGGVQRRMEIRTDERVSAVVGTAIIGDEQSVRRHHDELLLVVVGSGAVRVDGRHVLLAGDALVSEGDDPAPTLERKGDESALVAEVRLRCSSGAALNWVP